MYKCCYDLHGIEKVIPTDCCGSKHKACHRIGCFHSSHVQATYTMRKLFAKRKAEADGVPLESVLKSLRTLTV